MKDRRVVITGIGLITSLAKDVAGLLGALRSVRSGIGSIRRWDASGLTTRFGGEVFDFDPAAHGIDIREARRMDRFAQFGLAAAIEAAKDAGIDFSHESPQRCGVILGTGIGGLETVQEQYDVLRGRGAGRVSPFTVPKLMPNAAAAQVSIRLGLRGPNSVIATACSTGSNAIGDAGRAIQSNQADVMLAGGSEAALCELGLASFCAARAVSTRNDDPQRASRPWDKDRDGFVLSEGATVVVLEELEHARRRGAMIYAELAGYGVSADAYHITSPEVTGAGGAAAMRLAIEDAGLNLDAVDYVNAHGTSTEQGDVAETRGLHCVFGAHVSRLMVSSIKGQAGHLLGAAGALSVAATALALQHGFVPATANLDAPGEGCDLDYVPNTPRDRAINVALSNSFGFGGHNTSLLLLLRI